MAGRTQNLTMETLEPATPSSSIAAAATSNSQNQSLMPSPLPPSVSRLWRRAAQRKLRNQWSKLAAYRQQWASSSSAGKSHATSLVNAYLDQIETSIGAHVDAFSGVNLEEITSGGVAIHWLRRKSGYWVHCSDELYPGEFDDFSMCNLLSGETCEPVHPRLQIQKSNILALPSN
nr:uncharacterized protein LOC112491685 isoform X3 [Ziziphus jujuba var. spinosa]